MLLIITSTGCTISKVIDYVVKYCCFVCKAFTRKPKTELVFVLILMSMWTRSKRTRLHHWCYLVFSCWRNVTRSVTTSRTSSGRSLQTGSWRLMRRTRGSRSRLRNSKPDIGLNWNAPRQRSTSSPRPRMTRWTKSTNGEYFSQKKIGQSILFWRATAMP